MIFATADGRIFDHPELEMVGLDGHVPRPVRLDEVIGLPRGSDVFTMPGRAPMGMDPHTGETVVFDRFEGEPVFAVSAFMAPAYTQTLRPAFVAASDAPALPLYAYTTMGWLDGKFCVAGLRVDPDKRQDPYRFDRPTIERNVTARVREMGKNRVVGQLVRCSLEYGCRAAQNYFLDRWEAPLPVSIACNAQCVGCISLQPGGEFKAAHDRLSIPPTPAEVAAVALGHIERVEEAVVSFGQGCEGEPLLMGDLLTETTRLVRATTPRGTVNLNSNGSKPKTVARLIEAGLDSMRVSMNSPRPPQYTAYYNPRGYDFSDVRESLRLMREAGLFKSINLFVFPGVTDTDAELDALSALIDECHLDMIQLRNLNIDPAVYERELPPGSIEEGRGVVWVMEQLRARHPWLRFGYFNPPKERYRAWQAQQRGYRAGEIEAAALLATGLLGRADEITPKPAGQRRAPLARRRWQ
jgi:MoaA/NifB/PqqE/SkfB family radical SAM enzyme